MYRSLSGTPRDVALLIARVVLVVVMVAHAWQKLSHGLSDTAVVFAKFGIPLAIAAAAFTIVVEFVASAAILLGLKMTVPASFLVFVMAGAIVFVHGRNGIFVAEKGWELVGVIIVGTLALMASGPGRFSVDHLLDRVQQKRMQEIMRIRQPISV
ncbi:MAG: DoxX family protein [Pseudonocardia sp.]|nr:DoxX family protein [Pseudonocardia sp.]